MKSKQKTFLRKDPFSVLWEHSQWLTNEPLPLWVWKNLFEDDFPLVQDFLIEAKKALAPLIEAEYLDTDSSKVISARLSSKTSMVDALVEEGGIEILDDVSRVFPPDKDDVLTFKRVLKAFRERKKSLPNIECEEYVFDIFDFSVFLASEKGLNLSYGTPGTWVFHNYVWELGTVRHDAYKMKVYFLTRTDEKCVKETLTFLVQDNPSPFVVILPNIATIPRDIHPIMKKKNVIAVEFCTVFKKTSKGKIRCDRSLSDNLIGYEPHWKSKISDNSLVIDSRICTFMFSDPNKSSEAESVEYAISSRKGKLPFGFTYLALLLSQPGQPLTTLELSLWKIFNELWTANIEPNQSVPKDYDGESLANAAEKCATNIDELNQEVNEIFGNLHDGSSEDGSRGAWKKTTSNNPVDKEHPRKAVCLAIKRACELIGENPNKDLYNHLYNSLCFGTSVVYKPYPEIQWSVQFNNELTCGGFDKLQPFLQGFGNLSEKERERFINGLKSKQGNMVVPRVQNTNWRCEHCGYEFEKSKMPKKCPACRQLHTFSVHQGNDG